MTVEPVLLVSVSRDQVLESLHLGHLVIADEDGEVIASLGDPSAMIYPRSALKPFQAQASRSLLLEAGVTLDSSGTAIASASHIGADDHQIEAARLLAEAGLDEGALRCPPALPADHATLVEQRHPTRLANNCSGKHAAMLWAQVTAGGHPESYCSPNAVVQTRVREVIAASTGERLLGPGVDGCGAPAWVLPLVGLATGYARLAAGSRDLADVRDAMLAWPTLIGGHDVPDTQLMTHDLRVVAKRGAEGVMAAGFLDRELGGLGVAAKILDGADRAAGPAVAAALEALGAVVPPGVRRTPVLGGGVPHGRVSAVPAVARLVTERLGLR